jgi:hypothetical protein
MSRNSAEGLNLLYASINPNADKFVAMHQEKTILRSSCLREQKALGPTNLPICPTLFTTLLFNAGAHFFLNQPSSFLM